MTILKILQYPDALLKRVAKPVADVKDKEIQAIIDDMIETLCAASNCMALAATQLALDNPPSITVINDSTANGGVLCLVNPEIITRAGRSSDFEGCMSIGPGSISALVERAAHIRYKALDRAGKIIAATADDYFARCIQHEIDHLQGKLFIDLLSPLKRSRLLHKLEKARARE